MASDGSSTPIADKVKEIIAKQLRRDVETVTDDKHLINDLGADSLDIMELTMELQDVFDIKMPESEADKIQTVGDAIQAIEKIINKG